MFKLIAGMVKMYLTLKNMRRIILTGMPIIISNSDI
jgi:hypothetical protein